MVGKEYWSVGITLKPLRDSGSWLWSASCDFFDDGHCRDDSTQGKIHSRYFGQIEIVIDNVKRDVEKLGIIWNSPMLYIEGDDYPHDWREIIKHQAERIGFRCSY